MGAPGGPPPQVPAGWHVNWSEQYNQWFYINAATGAWQWEHPSGQFHASPPAASPAQQAAYYPPPPAQPQYGQPAAAVAATTTTAAATAPTERGLMGKIGEFTGHRPPSPSGSSNSSKSGHHKVLGTVAGLMTAAGAGALGAKLFGGKKFGHTAPPPSAPQAAYVPYSHQHYPAQSQPPPATHGFAPAMAMGVGAGGVAGAAGAWGAANMLPPHHESGGMSSAHHNSHSSGSPHMDSSPRLIIHAAAFCDTDVTSKVRSLVTPAQTVSIEKLVDEFGDPWPEAAVKMFSVLYQYGERPLEVWAGTASIGKFDIKNETLSKARMSFVNKEPDRIMCLIWGNESVLSKERISKLETDGELECTTGDLGNGGFYPWELRNLICYYRDEHGGVSIGHGRDNGTMRLPWNPLAKWG